jgi:hypothetical protein
MNGILSNVLVSPPCLCAMSDADMLFVTNMQQIFNRDEGNRWLVIWISSDCIRTRRGGIPKPV